MRQLLLSLVYLMFFFSGAASLIYEVVWVRSLSLIFGGTHLAVTTVLSVFMGGLALGSYLIGRRVDTLKKPLMFYGILEIGIAVFAVAFIGLMNNGVWSPRTSKEKCISTSTAKRLVKSRLLLPLPMRSPVVHASDGNVDGCEIGH